MSQSEDKKAPAQAPQGDPNVTWEDTASHIGEDYSGGVVLVADERVEEDRPRVADDDVGVLEQGRERLEVVEQLHAGRAEAGGDGGALHLPAHVRQMSLLRDDRARHRNRRSFDSHAVRGIAQERLEHHVESPGVACWIVERNHPVRSPGAVVEERKAGMGAADVSRNQHEAQNRTTAGL